MPPKDNITLGPGTLYFNGPEGLQPLGEVQEIEFTEEAETFAEDQEPVVKAVNSGEVTLTAEAKISPNVAKAFMAIGEACKRAAEALCKFARAAADFVVATFEGVDIAQLLKAAKARVALNEAPPRVRHLAYNSKKHRVRKKNINRAMREYNRRTTDERAD